MEKKTLKIKNIDCPFLRSQFQDQDSDCSAAGLLGSCCLNWKNDGNKEGIVRRIFIKYVC